MYIKRENRWESATHIMESGSGEQTPQYPSSSSSYINFSGVTNENWRGKNDPAERRRIQNRINQRAFRQRQRAGEATKQYRPRCERSESAEQSESPPTTPSPEGREKAVATGRPTTTAASSQPSDLTSCAGRVWDELAQLINRNFMNAAHTNAQILGLDMAALRAGALVLTPRPPNATIPEALAPIQIQYEVPHDPILDCIPHPRLRHNLLSAIGARRLDSAALSSCLRASGAMVDEQGQWMRGGLIVWSSPEQLSNWELSERFLRNLGTILAGCEDFVHSTNAWRIQRGERPFPIPRQT